MPKKKNPDRRNEYAVKVIGLRTRKYPFVKTKLIPQRNETENKASRGSMVLVYHELVEWWTHRELNPDLVNANDA